MTDLITLARTFATERHGNQKRKYSDEPYTVHLESVMEIVRSVPHDENMLIAALLHDVVEDTETTFGEIANRFEVDVYELVSALTDYTKVVGNRKHRKKLDAQRLSNAPARAQTIKLADLIDNTASIVERDPNFARVYLEEKQRLLEVMTKGDPTLYARAYEQLQEGQRKLIHDSLGGK
jgi:(p)ppGpp synthase/HD superfamily hydrolase